ncbi:CYTH domain-containing protein [Shewanella fidelis]|uniref:CYTH domain-containing protein n=1 Tax=Shewanella fidelis TaxID=173509 RepID=A0AAW8NJI7_9GAMM|nr:CYTH domain-containing protein [Shewanella fidelis]MDR8522435.1 CYTH domain-containing protein [Shewanella fidelis]MDW4813031.1 CYTH domain-containing protein [Shewanella fidelis]MDW4816710.1 CYTH domain-containing protein [Shewanella fidelis]MDW4821038.1 CYTH domain-containing protein [Shewanella fidelis]MDW4825427.1 CYTH domain-containing protein [Shewanella fidelis]
MEAEIELKLFFDEKNKKSLIKLLDNLPNCDAKGVETLTNGYFETADLALRKLDMGLRIRGVNQQLEQTIKTKGQVVGGIHSRPEYNVDVDQNFPQLNLFPKEIWPEGVKLEQIQANLYCLFNTDFTRQRWHIFVEDSLVEVALDIGEIRVDQAVDPICELEFELLAGDTSALLTLAGMVSREIPVRLGKASKAQRGYRLAGQYKPEVIDALTFIEIEPQQSLKQVAINLLTLGLDRWQTIEALILDPEQEPLALPMLSYRLRACTRLLKNTLKQFGLLETSFQTDFDAIEHRLNFIEEALSLFGIIDEDAALVAKLPQHQALVDAAVDKLQQLDVVQQVEQLIAEICYGRLQVHLVDLLTQLIDGTVVIDKELDLQHFADQMQENSWQKILAVMPQQNDLSSSDYLAVAKALDDSIFVGVAYGGLYPEKSRDIFRAPWQDLALGIRTLAAYRQLKSISETAYLDISQWLENKEQSLVQAMEFSRHSALKNEPYWR